MNTLKILSKKQRKNFYKQLLDQFGTDYMFGGALFTNKVGKIYLITKDIESINFEDLRVNSMGLYLGRWDKLIRLSIEGSQLLGPRAKKNVYEVDDKLAKTWMNGDDIECNEEFDGFVIIKHGKDYLGSGNYGKDKILNYVPKERRVKF